LDKKAKNWYVIHTYSGQELKVKEHIQKFIENKGLTEYFVRIIIPSEEVVEVKFGRKGKSKRKFFFSTEQSSSLKCTPRTNPHPFHSCCIGINSASV